MGQDLVLEFGTDLVLAMYLWADATYFLVYER
jgi:hypothetical protein